jgi:hypothetical protein
MRVTITTDGGFTGRGIGSASAEIDEAMLAELRPEEWREEYRAHGADLVNYTLTLGERRVTWNETAEIPEDLRRLIQRVWK